MALLTKEIETVLTTGGFVRFPKLSEATISTNQRVTAVTDSFSRAKLTVDSGANTILFTSQTGTTTDYNCVNVHTLDSQSAIGPVSIPGYVYTGNFSGCVYYLYKTGLNEVTGVHAYNGMVTVTTKRFLRSPKITQVPREFGPQGHFTGGGGATQICRHPTRGQLQLGKTIGDPAGEDCLNFLSCVERTVATTFLFSTKGTKEGVRVRRLLDKFIDKF
jgi:hypothetical protein